MRALRPRPRNANDRIVKKIHRLTHRGHPIEGLSIEREIYWLMTVFGASRRLYQISDGENHSFDAIRRDCEEGEASRLLISVAIMIRSQMDARGPRPADLDLNRKKVMGHFWTEGNTRQPLGLRDACNKIIHATGVNFPCLKAKKPSRTYLGSKVELEGFQGDARWRAVLDVMKFAEAAYVEIW